MVAAQTGSAVPTTSQTSPSSVTPAPRVAAISSRQPSTTGVPGASPVASANALVIGPSTAVAGSTGGSSAGSSPTASSSSGDQARARGSSSPVDEPFEKSTADSPQHTRAAYVPGVAIVLVRAKTSGSSACSNRALKAPWEESRLTPESS